MEDIYYTYQEFYTHTEAISYILIIIFLICTACFWSFLTGKDEDNNEN